MQSFRPEGAGPYPEDALEEAEKKRKAELEAAARAMEAAERAAFPSSTLADLPGTIAAIVADGKVPLLLSTKELYDATLAALKLMDGRGLNKEAWDAAHAKFEVAEAAKKLAWEEKAVEDHAAAIAKWHDDTAARKEERHEIDLNGGEEYVPCNFLWEKPKRGVELERGAMALDGRVGHVYSGRTP